MEPLLLLVHRIPYPPNKGDKIRSYHLMEYLLRRFDVHLAAFIDDPNDNQYRDLLEEKCASVCLESLNPGKAKIKSLTGLLRNQALSIPYYYSSSMQAWIDTSIRQQGIKKFVVFSSPMAQYLNGYLGADTTSILDFVDIDSDKWKQYATSQTWPYNWIYRRESRKLFQFEKAMAERFDLSLFVSQAEADLFRSMLGTSDARVAYFNNGVDFRYFDPEADLVNPYTETNPIVVFTGAMDYWANVDGVVWFARQIFPLLQAKIPKLKFYIVGGNPSQEVKNLATDAIVVTGRVDDIRAYIKYADLVVAPLRIARGVQNKVLEAMALNKPVVATEEAISGIEDCEDFRPHIAKDAEQFAHYCEQWLQKNTNTSGAISSRNCIKRHYDWDLNLDILGDTLNTEQISTEMRA